MLETAAHIHSLPNLSSLLHLELGPSGVVGRWQCECDKQSLGPANQFTSWDLSGP